MRALNLLHRVALFLVFAIGAAIADPHDVTFDKTGDAYIKCACILAKSACASSLGDALGGSERNTWTSVGHAMKGNTVDLSNYCWTKRNAADGGEGFCCELYKDSRDVRFFWGDLDLIR